MRQNFDDIQLRQYTRTNVKNTFMICYCMPHTRSLNSTPGLSTGEVEQCVFEEDRDDYVKGDREDRLPMDERDGRQTIAESQAGLCATPYTPQRRSITKLRAMGLALRRKGTQNVLRVVQLNKSCQRNCDVDRKLPCYSYTVNQYVPNV